MTTTTLKLPLQNRTDTPALGLSHIWTLFSLWYDRAHQRHQLSELSLEQLKDIGVTRDIAHVEAVKPFWQN
jgi:uncharacterized protein YjiS (DUF1127 family)